MAPRNQLVCGPHMPLLTPAQEGRVMESWPDYEKVTIPNSGVMDQITQNAALISARIGVQVGSSKSSPCLGSALLARSIGPLRCAGRLRVCSILFGSECRGGYPLL